MKRKNKVDWIPLHSSISAEPNPLPRSDEEDDPWAYMMHGILLRIMRYTEGADRISDGGWGAAEMRRAEDNLLSGRLEWRTARKNAITALNAIKQRDVETARVFFGEAVRLYMAAVERRMGGEVRAALSTDAGLRAGGPKPKPMIDRLLEALDAQPDYLAGKARRAAAIQSDPGLLAEYRDKPDGTVRKAIQRRREKMQRHNS